MQIYNVYGVSLGTLLCIHTSTCIVYQYSSWINHMNYTYIIIYVYIYDLEKSRTKDEKSDY